MAMFLPLADRRSRCLQTTMTKTSLLHPREHQSWRKMVRAVSCCTARWRHLTLHVAHPAEAVSAFLSTMPALRQHLGASPDTSPCYNATDTDGVISVTCSSVPGQSHARVTQM